jgi:type IV secretory pathway VirB2 component (pilin)
MVMLPDMAQAMGGIPQISGFLNQVQTTVTGPVGGTLFFTGVVKMGVNCYKAGGIQGLGDGGVAVATSGFIIGGGPWIASLPCGGLSVNASWRPSESRGRRVSA